MGLRWHRSPVWHRTTHEAAAAGEGRAGEASTSKRSSDNKKTRRQQPQQPATADFLAVRLRKPSHAAPTDTTPTDGHLKGYLGSP